MPTKKQRSEPKGKPSGQVVGRSLDPVVRQLIEAYDLYLVLLGEELNSLTGVAYVHGWRSSRVEEGKAWREKIAELKFALDYEKQERLARFAQECRRNAGLGDSQPNPTGQGMTHAIGKEASRGR